MRHRATAGFWRHYDALPQKVREVADKNFALLKLNPRHPSLHLKKTGELWSVRAGLSHRALGIDYEGGIAWIWIGPHGTYDRLIK